MVIQLMYGIHSAHVRAVGLVVGLVGLFASCYFCSSVDVL